MRVPQLFEPLFQMFPLSPQLFFQRNKSLLIRLHAEDALCGLLEYDNFRGFLIVRYLRYLIPQSKETQLELVPPLALEHVVSPPFVIILRVGRPGAGAFSVVADLLEHSAAALQL
uniref:Uncharacterized protein n=1 Tax=Anguilla anguilla TaxID=7936 RepID=A0A0E9WZ05_ANGAN